MSEYAIEHHYVGGKTLYGIFVGTRREARAEARRVRKSLQVTTGIVAERWLRPAR